MTDKQIKDRVNIKECKYYCNGKCERYEEFVEADYADYSIKCICEKENDLGTYDICDYQQFQVKEQECEELKYLAEHNGRVCNKRLDKIDELEHDLNDLKAENEELKKCIKHLHNLCGNETDKQYKYKQALTEIKQLLEDALDTDKTSAEQSFDNLYEALEKCEVLDKDDDCPEEHWLFNKKE